MALNVVMVTGPRRSGKSTLITGLINEVCSHQPHYIRLTEKSGTKHPPRQAPACVDCGVATATWVTYERDRVFETLPETLAAVQKHDELGCVLIEADTDPNLRHAYPYDTQLFTVPAPARVEDIFRTPQQTRQALQAMMNDSVAFAGEIFGLTPDAAAQRRREQCGRRSSVGRAWVGRACVGRSGAARRHERFTDHAPDAFTVGRGTGNAHSVPAGLPRTVGK
jgi:energy-coupling factor transporter ATP-binding protein EcfA2